MIEKILIAIAIKLGELFPDASVYINSISQGLSEPAFYVHCINVDRSEQIAGRFLHTMPFEVIYFTHGNESEKYAVMEQLIVSLREIALQDGDLIRGTEINGRIIDNELHVFVNYDLFLMLEQEEAEKMGSIEINERIK